MSIRLLFRALYRSVADLHRDGTGRTYFARTARQHPRIARAAVVTWKRTAVPPGGAQRQKGGLPCSRSGSI